jgi:tRNA(Ile)-lysidine synthase TilS/MesJ
MNLLHKAEFASNLPKVPMHDYGVTVIRPLIFISEQEIRTFADQHRFSRIVCQCPVGQTSLRRKVKEIITGLEETFPNARENLSQASLHYGSDKALRN